jgi:hypothetical protein
VSDTPTFTSIGQAFLAALAGSDFDRIGKLLHPHVRIRELVPGAVLS